MKGFDDLVPRPLPAPPPLWKAMGPGVVWMALAQGTGELYFWPYFAAKYGALYLCLLLPACVLQTPINLEIGRYTMLTGESVFRGFTRLRGGFGAFMWIFFAVNFVLIGGFASAGGTALADIVPWPRGWEVRERTLLWSYALTAVFAAALLAGCRAYRVVERFMFAVAIVTALGLVLACLHPRILAALPGFLGALVVPAGVPAPPTDPRELESFVTMICYSGLGGFWSLFYSFWLREKGYGMAAHAEHLEDPGTERRQIASFEGCRIADEPGAEARWRAWMRTLRVDTAVGVLGNLATTAMLALLAYAILHPQGKVPEGWRMAAEQGDFFGALWGPAARLVFLVVAGCFLMDSWLGGVDAVARVHAEMTCTYFGSARGVRRAYVGFLLAMVAVTWIVLPMSAPDGILAATGVMSLFAVPVFSIAIWRMNRVHLAPRFPAWTAPARGQRAAFIAVIAFYVAAAAAYAWIRLGPGRGG